jgi:hypothetical protein
MGRVWSGDKRQVRDDVLRLVDAYEVDEIFVWHHVGYFGDDRERAALAAFAEAAIEPLR